MKYRRRNSIDYTISQCEIKGEERLVKVYFDVQPPEPDVGIFGTSVAVDSVFAKSIGAAEEVDVVRRRMLNIKDEYYINVTGITAGDHDKFVDQYLAEMESWEDEP